ncbi:c-type cytochrome [Rhodopirellula sp. JC740]|uniref:C-type cytochrome n=1 Tax=Rhodopirellula halodulae TaxID=2894198 RepID=A0ABS8NDC3_9BACT|nr:PVC-type heme-binding CxxCH protein [Rhodopirellula sp. JC740]MCC9641550.1 c-type cytochrome [Rhodopirellula sp. JC740]
MRRRGSNQNGRRLGMRDPVVFAILAMAAVPTFLASSLVAQSPVGSVEIERRIERGIKDGKGPANVGPAVNVGPAGNEDVARVMREFEGRGDLGDDSPPASPVETVSRLRVPDDLRIELVAGEPDLAQPIDISFDFKGRMWVVEYRQYPFPAGLKVVRYDQHLRAVFDATPKPPPHHVPGADRVSVWEDTNGAGTYDSRRVVIDGLNIATSVAVTTSGIWVLNAPYLLFYPDADQDAVIDDEPIVHLSGFGLEDTHAVANSLRLGPDGWIYGANGSTTTARVRAPLSESPEQTTDFEGQCVWRYQPEEHRFEIFAEGGGNTFGLEIDRDGFVFSGTNNGKTRGMFYPQGSYGRKNWGKHGPLTNPHAYGFFEHMRFEGDSRRFTQALVRYQDNLLPTRYQNQFIAINPLQRCVITSRVLDDASSFRTEDIENTIETDDRWFRPVAITVGPDGAVYFADWYDTRLTHVDPRDNWHKTSGRVYRLVPAKSPPNETNTGYERLLPSRTKFDLTTMSASELTELLAHPSRTLQRLAVEVFASHERPSVAAIATLRDLLGAESDSSSLPALWILSRRGEMTEEDWSLAMDSSNEHVRRWSIRLIGDRGIATESQAAKLRRMAADENNPRVRSQLASTAARLSSTTALPMLRELMLRQKDQSDLHLPLLIWWAVESHCESSGELLLKLLEVPRLWESELVQQTILSRLMRRFAAEDSSRGYQLCARLLELAPTVDAKAELMRGFEEATVGRKNATYPESLTDQFAIYRKERPGSDLLIRLRQGDPQATQTALQSVEDGATPIQTKVRLIEAFGDLRTPAAVPMLRRRLMSDPSDAVKQAALLSLAQFPTTEIGTWIASAYQTAMDGRGNLREVAIRVLASRDAWAMVLMDQIDAAKIPVEWVPMDAVVQMRSLENSTLQDRLQRHWGLVRATPQQKQARIREVKDLVQAASMFDEHRGKDLFAKHCGNCHRLFGEGGMVGPELTGYERSNLDFLLLAVIDPSAGIREEFTNYRLLTNDGRVISGLLEDQTPQWVTIRTAEGNAIRISRDEIESLQASAVSLMPENLVAPLSAAEIRDLMGYLQMPTAVR